MKRALAGYLPLMGILVGVIAAAVYWLAAQLWPSSVAVILSLCAIEVLNGRVSEYSFARLPLRWTGLFLLWIKYNVLMALTAADLGFPVPANVALGLIMICGQAASRALMVATLASGAGNGSAAVTADGSATGTANDDVTGRADSGATGTDDGRAAGPSSRISSQDLGIALVVGFAPATLLGIPGLMGLAAAILARIGFAAYVKRESTPAPLLLSMVQQLTEACFYLGALATWKYV